MQSVPNNYETDLILPIMDAAASLAGTSYAAADASAKTALKVIGDHSRAAVYLISDGVLPSNVGRGYIVRRLIRRVVMKVCFASFVTICLTGLTGQISGSCHQPSVPGSIGWAQQRPQ